MSLLCCVHGVVATAATSAVGVVVVLGRNDGEMIKVAKLCA